MRSEEIIILIFVGIVVVGTPLMIWLADRDKNK